ncbi:MAG: inositol 2-dehydrogenase [Chloroflexia bacterium]|nr:inositol 2-dehydrogenase [Chloroflexia bacterium]
MNARPRVGLIGCGRIGKIHLRTLLAHPERCEFAGLVDSNEGALRTIAAEYRLETVSTDISTIFDDPTIDAVIIASSTETHAACIEEAARTGTSAFTEKPIALDLESTDRALAAVHWAGTRLQVGFQRRFDSGYAAAHRKIADGELGTIEMIRDAMRDPAPPPPAYLEKSGGLFRDMTIHNFDCVRWLKGHDPVEIFAVGSALTGDEVLAAGDIDTSIVTMRFADGSLASIENSRRSGFGYDVRTEVFGSKGAIHIGDSRQTPVRHLTASGVREDHQYFFLERFKDAYEAEVLSFLQAVVSDTEVEVTGADGRAALRLAILAEESRRLGRPIAAGEVANGIDSELESRMTISA